MKRKLPWLIGAVCLLLVVFGVACLVSWARESNHNPLLLRKAIPPEYQVLEEDTGEISHYLLNITDAKHIGLDAVDEWMEARTQGEGFQWLMYTDPDSWDAFIYIPALQEAAGDLTNADVTMAIAEGETGRNLNVYLHTADVKTDEKTAEEQLLHFAAPMRGAWPNAVAVFVDGAELPCDGMEFNK